MRPAVLGGAEVVHLGWDHPVVDLPAPLCAPLGLGFRGGHIDLWSLVQPASGFGSAQGIEDLRHDLDELRLEFRALQVVVNDLQKKAGSSVHQPVLLEFRPVIEADP